MALLVMSYKRFTDQILDDLTQGKASLTHLLAGYVKTRLDIKEWIAWQYRKTHGCPIPKSLQAQMKELRNRFKLNYFF